MKQLQSIDKRRLLEQLGEINYEQEKGAREDAFEKMSLASALLTLTEINHENEYALCRKVAEYLLEKVPEPEGFEEEKPSWKE